MVLAVDNSQSVGVIYAEIRAGPGHHAACPGWPPRCAPRASRVETRTLTTQASRRCLIRCASRASHRPRPRCWPAPATPTTAATWPAWCC
ncbi:MAG: hypothetical protein WKG07_48175 [Hymenobacter sp.]